MQTNFATGFIIALILLLAYKQIENYNNDLVYIKSTVDGVKYLVRNLDDKQAAADTLATVKINLVNLCSTLKTRYPNDPAIERMISKFNADRLMEVERGSKYTSYSVNKGEKMVLCIRNRGGAKETLESQNTIMFVAVHELAHIMTESVGHTDEFWSNFKFLLKHATRLGIYKNVDYSKSPEDYCGIEVTDSPLNDNSIKETIVNKN